jgi:membrane protease YdiL (CAAX protease family)
MTTLAQSTAAAPLSGLARRHPLTGYFVLAYAISWALVLPMTFSTNLGLGLLPYALPDALGLALYVLASFVGPAVAALIIAGLAEGRAGVLAVLRPIARWRVGPQWYAVALLANLAIWLTAYSLVLGPGLPAAALARWPLLVTVFLPMVAFGIVIPSIGEEPGWRGFALPRLQGRYGPLRATLILGALHGLWHLPALGTLMLGPLRPAQVAPFLLTAVGATFLYTWIFNRTGGSVLLAILTHAASNAASQWLSALIEQSGIALPQSGLAGWLVGDGWVNVLAYGATALLLVALTRGRLGATTEAGTAVTARGTHSTTHEWSSRGDVR